MEQKKILDFGKIFKLLRQRKKRLIINTLIAAVLASIWIFPEPRFYSCDVELAPEGGSELGGGTLSSIASSFGFNIGAMEQNDAIYPLLYPDLFTSPEFLVSLFDIQVETADGSVKTDYYTYMTKHQKKNALTEPFKNLIRSIKNWISPKKDSDKFSGDPSKLDPFRLSQDDYELMTSVASNIMCSVDKKTNVITIDVKDQDPLVCALLADSIKVRLQHFITDYRTSKARLDMEYYEQLTEKSKQEYEDALALYSAYTDAHKDVILQAYISERDKLENDVSLKYQTYNAMTMQLDAARAKVQESTPSFTTLKTATVPVKPAGPKRMIFVLTMMFFTFVVTALYICRHRLVGSSNEEQQPLDSQTEA